MIRKTPLSRAVKGDTMWNYVKEKGNKKEFPKKERYLKVTSRKPYKTTVILIIKASTLSELYFPI